MTQIPYTFGARWTRQQGQRPTLPFYFLPTEGFLTPRSGQPVTFARAGRAVGIDAAGRLYEVPAHMPAAGHVDLDGDGVRESAGLVMGGQSPISFALHSNDLLQGVWSLVNSGSLTLYDRHGIVGLYRLLDTDATNSTLLVQTVPTTAMNEGQLMTLGFVVARDPTAPGVGTYRARFQDTTAGVERTACTWTFDSAGVPTFASTHTLVMGTGGHFLGIGPRGEKLYMQVVIGGTGVVKANTHRIEIAVSTTGSHTGVALLVGMVTVMGGQRALPYVNRATTGQASVEETWSVPFEALPQPMTVYVRSAALVTGARDFVQIGGLSGGEGLLTLTSTDITHHNGSASVNATVGFSPGLGAPMENLVEYLGVLRADGAVRADTRIGGGTVGAGSWSQPLPLAASWGAAPILRLQGNNFKPHSIILGVAVAWGERDMDYMAAFFG
jgi:hypothetical protein